MPPKCIVISANTSWYLFNFRKNLILALLNAGYRILAVAPQDSYSPRLLELGCEFHHIHIDQGGTNPLTDLKTILDYYCIYRRSSPAVMSRQELEKMGGKGTNKKGTAI